MSNMWGRSGAPMVQPTKDELRLWLAESRMELKKERNVRYVAEIKLETAMRKLGSLVLEGKIAVPVEKLGEVVLQIASEEEAEAERQKLLANA